MAMTSSHPMNVAVSLKVSGSYIIEMASTMIQRQYHIDSLRKLFSTNPELSSGDRRRKILKDVLEYDIKPLFLASAHPRVNLDSGRKLPRTAGGSAAAQDMYEDQLWKRPGLGCWNVIKWCVSQLEVNIMFVPPYPRFTFKLFYRRRISRFCGRS